jgi:putative protease
VRIGTPKWIAKLRFDDYEAIILSYKRSDWDNFEFQDPIIQQNRHKIRIEFPKFISENKMGYYRQLALKFVSYGFNHFVISHLSQKLLLPAHVKISCNENVYVLNDAAAKFVRLEQMNDFVYPLENDFENLVSMTDKQGIVPLYYYPELFHSRMPVKINQKDNFFTDENNKKYRLNRKDGMTQVFPLIPVCLFQHRQRIEQSGFRKFLIDFSAETITANVVKRIFKKYQDCEVVQPSTNFNFKLGLK